MVDGMVQQFPEMNAVACHTKHEAKFDGVQNVDWFHQHFEIDIQLGGTIGYEVRSLRISLLFGLNMSSSCMSVALGHSSVMAMEAKPIGAGECL